MTTTTLLPPGRLAEIRGRCDAETKRLVGGSAFHDVGAQAHFDRCELLDHAEAQADHITALTRERDALRAFAQDVMEGWPDTNDCEGLQGLATKHGLLKPEIMAAPCGPDCACLEFVPSEDFPTECYRKTELLIGRAAAALKPPAAP